MKMLSTPTASTKNGITSTIINVAFVPAREQAPNEAATESRTMITPTIPTVILASILKKRIKFY